MSSGRTQPQKLCIYPGCQRPAVPPHVLGGPQPSFCDLEAHNALTAYQERQRLAAEGAAPSQVPASNQEVFNDGQ
jgi:hypothetical protein